MCERSRKKETFTKKTTDFTLKTEEGSSGPEPELIQKSTQPKTPSKQQNNEE